MFASRSGAVAYSAVDSPRLACRPIKQVEVVHCNANFVQKIDGPVGMVIPRRLIQADDAVVRPDVIPGHETKVGREFRT